MDPAKPGQRTGTMPTTRTWAAIAAGPQRSGDGPAALEASVAIPAKKEREILIKAASQKEDYTKRTPIEVVEAVNKNIGEGKAVATRRMRSGDVVVTLKDRDTQLPEDDDWVPRVFGTDAVLRRFEVTLIAKGVPAQVLARAQDEGQLLRELRKQSSTHIVRCKRRLPRETQHAYASILLYVDNVDTARRLCNEGLLWNAQMFTVEPYSPDLKTQQCFRCFGFGHIARYCEKTARCGHCAGTKHTGGGEDCPTIKAGENKHCINCKGPHAAWDQRCPTVRAQKERAKRAYLHRPRQLAVTQRVSRGSSMEPPALRQWSSSETLAQNEEQGDNFITVENGKKRRIGKDGVSRPRGRPPKDSTIVKPAILPKEQFFAPRQGNGYVADTPDAEMADNHEIL